MSDSTTTSRSYAETEPWTTRSLPMPADISEADARIALAVGLFAGDLITIGRGSEIAGLSYRAFVDALSERRIPWVTITEESWAEDLKTLESLRARHAL